MADQSLDRPLVTVPRAHVRRSLWEGEPLVALAFLLPSLVLLGIFVFYPLVYVVYLSLLNWDLITPATTIGLKNYGALLHDPYFLQALQVTVIISLASIVITLPCGFLTHYLTMLQFVQQGLQAVFDKQQDPASAMQQVATRVNGILQQ